MYASTHPCVARSTRCCVAFKQQHFSGLMHPCPPSETWWRILLQLPLLDGYPSWCLMASLLDMPLPQYSGDPQFSLGCWVLHGMGHSLPVGGLSVACSAAGACGMHGLWCQGASERALLGELLWGRVGGPGSCSCRGMELAGSASQPACGGVSFLGSLPG